MSILSASFRRTSDNLSAMFRRTLGKLLDFMMIFLVSFDELLWQASRLLGWFRQNFRRTSGLPMNSRTPNEIAFLTMGLDFALCLAIVVNHAHVKTHFDLDNYYYS